MLVVIVSEGSTPLQGVKDQGRDVMSCTDY